jgi:hypothetical protein
VTLVDISDKHCGHILTRCDRVPLPVGGCADEGIGEAWVGNECVEKVLIRPYIAFLVNCWHIAQLGPRPTAGRHEISRHTIEGLTQLGFEGHEVFRRDEASEYIGKVVCLVVVL